jgi:hypothetical protein
MPAGRAIAFVGELALFEIVSTRPAGRDPMARKRREILFGEVE